MTVKFKKNTVHMNVKGGDVGDATHDIAHKVGEALTKGGGTKGYLAVSETLQDTLQVGM